MKKTIDYSLLVAVIAVTCFGAYMILSATYYADIFDESNNPLISFLSDLEKIIIGMLVMIVAIYFKASWVKKLAPYLFFGSLISLIVLAIIGDPINGSKRWLNIAGFSFMPSELMKAAAIFYFAKIYEKMNRSNDHYNWAWVITIILIGLSSFIIAKQPDLSSALILCLIIGVMLLIGGAKFIHLVLIIGIGASLVFVAVEAEPYRKARLQVWKTDDTTLDGYEAQQNQSLMAIVTGGIYGVGADNAYQTKNGLYAAGSDTIFATIVETRGFIGAIFLIGAYIFIIWRIVRIALTSTSLYAAIVCTGVASMIGFQAVIHTYVGTKLFPVTGVTLPFISSGGTSIIVLLGCIGVVLNLSSNPEGI
jgi:cell division protein FtsW